MYDEELRREELSKSRTGHAAGSAGMSGASGPAGRQSSHRRQGWLLACRPVAFVRAEVKFSSDGKV